MAGTSPAMTMGKAAPCGTAHDRFAALYPSYKEMICLS
jgi:hypothetical protein